MLVGPNGSGRRTLARLACHVSKVTAFEANLKDGQKGFQWHGMLKAALHNAGVLGR
jgi:ABC-type Mn2+/Zn2+ transport system ATPase subunit